MLHSGGDVFTVGERNLPSCPTKRIDSVKLIVYGSLYCGQYLLPYILFKKSSNYNLGEKNELKMLPIDMS